MATWRPNRESSWRGLLFFHIQRSMHPMASRSERLAQQSARARAKLAATRKTLAQLQTQQRREAQKALMARRMHVGLAAEAAGLFALDDDTLACLIGWLRPFAQQ